MMGRLIQVMTLMILAVLLWTAVVEALRLVRMSGHLVPAGRVMVVSYPDGGVVVDVLVRQGQPVERGSVMLLVADELAQFSPERRPGLSEFVEEAARLNGEISGGQDRMKLTALRSPVNGVVNRIYIGTGGSVVRAGDPAVEIMPLGSVFDGGFHDRK